LAEGRRPRFSVLLPTHDRADVLPFAVRSALCQSEPDFELLVVADGCTDGTVEAVRSFGDPRIRLFDLPKGPGFGYGNRNRALREARGELVAFLPHDDLWTPDHLERTRARLLGSDAEIAASRPVWFVAPGLAVPVGFHLGHAATRARFLAREANGLPAGCVVHRRESLDRHGYWREDLPSGADWDLWVRILEGSGGRLEWLEEATCIHFRADWRPEPSMAPGWRLFASVDGLVPPELRFPVPEGTTEQEAVWRVLAADPAGFSRRLRSGVAQVLDARLAESDRLMAAVLRNRDCEDPRAVLAAMEEAGWVMRSGAWRLVNSLRRARDAVLPPGSRRRRAFDAMLEPLRRGR